MPVAVQSDEPGSRLRPFLVARPPWRGQWIAEAHQRRTVLVIAVKVSSGRMRENQFSSCNMSLPFRGYRRTLSTSCSRDWLLFIAFSVAGTLWVEEFPNVP